MVQPHLIVLDLDGTLLTDDKTISPKTMDTLKKVQQQGHQVMIATGRPFRSSKMYYEQLDLKTPIVNFNGAYVHHPKSNIFLPTHSPIELSAVSDIVESLQPYNVTNIIAEVMDDIYFERYDKHLVNLFGIGSPKIMTGGIRKHLKDHPTSMLLHTDEYDVPEIRQFLANTKADVIDHRRWGDPYHVIELIRSGIHKADGLNYVANYLQIPRERIIAFGDEDNDLEMLDFAGTGVAMGNAIQDLQSIANVTTMSNNDDGIAHYLIERLHIK